MYQYIGLIWDSSNVQHGELARSLAMRLSCASHTWRVALKLPGLYVYESGERFGSSESFTLSGGSGVVLGTVFDKNNGRKIAPAPESLDDHTSGWITRTRAKYLMERYWGRYVAFIHDSRLRKTYVTADPSGGLPCLLSQYEGVALIFSCPQICQQLGLPPFSINWDYVRAHALVGGMQARESGLVEVSEIIGGECIEFCGGRLTRTMQWNPLEMAERDAIEDVDVAIECLRDVTRSCVRSWASCYDGIVLALSGGLDSAIVLACLVSAGKQQRTACLNYVTDDPDGDEREFARAAARNAGCRLIEKLHDDSVNLDRMLDVVPSVRPWDFRYHVEHSDFEDQLARECGATALFSGGGGDQVFFNWKVHLALRDFVRRHGIRFGLGPLAWDVARIEGTSVWRALVKGVYHGVRRTRVDLSAELSQRNDLLMPSDPALIARYLTPPWLEGREDYAVGKYWQLFNLATPAIFYDPLGSASAPEYVKPLRSQPLIELVMRIPTYVLIHGGWERAIARRAFEREIPRCIIRRKTKGGLGDHSARVLHRNRRFVKEMLLDGLLVKEGLLDREKVEAALPGEKPITGLAYLTLTDHLSTEVWLRKWTDLRRSSAAAA